MKSLKDILYGVNLTAVSGSTDIEIHSIQFDSRKLQKQDAFVAIKGTVSDGHQYIEGALEAGVSAVICEEFPSQLADSVT